MINRPETESGATANAWLPSPRVAGDVYDWLEDEAARIEAAAKDRRTLVGNDRDWTLWREFHQELTDHGLAGLDPLRITPGMMLHFVMWCDLIRKDAPATVNRRITGVLSVARRKPGAQISDKVAAKARAYVERIGLDPEKAARGRGQAVPFTPDELRRVAAVFDTCTLTGMRDKSIALMGFSLAARSSRISNLDEPHMRSWGKDLDVHIAPAKKRAGFDTTVYASQDPQCCPVRAWHAWRDASGVVGGPAYRPVDRWGNLGTGQMAPDTITRIIGAASEAAGLGRRTGHSWRSGFITSTRAAGKRVEKIKDVSGHSLTSRSFWIYIREADRRQDGAGEGLL